MAETMLRNQLPEGGIYHLIREDIKSIQRGMYIGYGRGEVVDSLHYFVLGMSDKESDPLRALAVSDTKLTCVDDKTLSSDAFLELNISHASHLHSRAMQVLLKRAGLI